MCRERGVASKDIRHVCVFRVRHVFAMCPPVCSAALASFINLALLVWGIVIQEQPANLIIFYILPFAASVTLFIFSSTKRIAWWAGVVLLFFGVLKLLFAIVFVVGTAQVGLTGSVFAALGAAVFTLFAIISAVSGVVDLWAGYSFAPVCRRCFRSERLLDGSEMSDA